MLVRAAFAAVGAFVSELIPAQGIRTVPQGETLNGRLPREKDLAGVTANGTAPVGHTGPAAPGAAVTPAGDIPPSPAGPSALEWLTPIITEALADHQPYRYHSDGFLWCLDRNRANDATRGDWTHSDWVDHVAPLIAAAISKAAAELPHP